MLVLNPVRNSTSGREKYRTVEDKVGANYPFAYRIHSEFILFTSVWNFNLYPISYMHTRLYA